MPQKCKNLKLVSAYSKSEAGAGILSAVIGVAVLAAMIVGVQGALDSASLSDKKALSGASFSEVSHTIEAYMRDTLETTNSCLRPQDFALSEQSQFGSLEANFSSDIINTITNNITDEEIVTFVKVAMKKSNKTFEATKRCQSPTEIQDSNNVAENHINFCLIYEYDTGAPKDSIMGSPGAFSEVTVMLIDTKTGQKTSCNNFINNKQSAAYVAMTTYWAPHAGKARSYRSQNHFFLVTRGNN